MILDVRWLVDTSLLCLHYHRAFFLPVCVQLFLPLLIRTPSHVHVKPPYSSMTSSSLDHICKDMFPNKVTVTDTTG